VPTSLILTGRGRDFDRFLPAEHGDDRYSTNTLFFDDPERAAIVVDFALAELRLEDNTTLEADPYRGFYREYFRFMIRRQLGRKSPPWFEEGLVQIFAAIDFNKKWITFAMIGDGFGGEKTGDFNRLLDQRAILPLAELFADPPPQTGAFWNAEAYAFVHLCLYGENQKFQKPFLKFLTRLSREPPSEAVFRECFGMTYKQMELELRGYIGFTNHKYYQFTAKKGHALPEPPPFTLRAAGDADAGRIVGEALRLGGHDGEAHLALIAPYVRGERNARLLAALGLDERRAGNDERARRFLEAAATAKVNRARAWIELAQLRFADARAKAGPDGKLEPEQLAPVLQALDTARRQPPPLPSAYGLTAEAWRASRTPPTREQFNAVLEGVKRFPRSAPLVMSAVLLASESGFTDEARELASWAAKYYARTSEGGQFELLASAFARDAEEKNAPASSAPPPAAAKIDPFAK